MIEPIKAIAAKTASINNYKAKKSDRQQKTHCQKAMGLYSSGWGGRIRTSGCRYQKPMPYHLATPQRKFLNLFVIDVVFENFFIFVNH